MDLSKIQDITAKADKEVGQFRLQFFLSPELLQTNPFELAALKWNSVKYDKNKINNVPDDKRGIYAFAISVDGDVLPKHSYILYIGIAGLNSKRSLRARYRDYFSVSKVIRRPRIARMIAKWSQVLRFHYATIGDEITSDQLRGLEKQLIGALMPPMSIGDLEASLKRKKAAF